VFLERPEIPQGIDPQNARLEVVTEFVEAPDPEVKRKFRSKNNVEIVDNALIEFGNLLVVPGKAVSTGDGGFSLDDPTFLRQDGLHVAKQWLELEDGGRFLIESVDWEEAEPSLRDLPPQRQAGRYTPSRVYRTASTSRPIPLRVRESPRHPMRLASLDYRPQGFLVDYTTLPSSQSSYNFETGKMYLIESSFYVGSGTITFNPGCVIKYSNNAFLQTIGPLDFPNDTQQKVVFTSKDDNGVHFTNSTRRTGIQWL
jgi:hypothetical protein